MPTIPNIRTSVENQSVLVLDEHAKNGVFRRDARGRLIAFAGGFSVVFPYEDTNGEKWAFRCWHSIIENAKQRCSIISKAINGAHLGFLCDFNYVERGINVDGEIYPTTRMRWIEGETIKKYICNNRDSKDLLIALADNFLKMVQALHAKSFAHGDLQHGNILVDKNNQLYLVDYDSFYCSDLKGEQDIVKGLVDYQHPSRQENKYVSEKLDYFSELIIYLSILAIAESPSLVDKYQVEDADRLLFSKEDFADIKKSQIYKDIHKLGKSFVELLEVLEKYLKCNNIEHLIPFDMVLKEKKISFKASSTKAKRNKQKVTISWEVPFNADVFLKEGNKGKQTKCEKKGQHSIMLDKTTTYELVVKLAYGQTIKKKITVKVCDESEVEFSADKYYVFPSIPVTLSWSVKNAKNVWLNNTLVDKCGAKVVEPTKNTSYTLLVQDEFGKKKETIEIGMLPIPIVKSILVPTPNLAENISISSNLPRLNLTVKLPEIEMSMPKTRIPYVPSLTELGLNVELQLPKKNPWIKWLAHKIVEQIKSKIYGYK